MRQMLVETLQPPNLNLLKQVELWKKLKNLETKK